MNHLGLIVYIACTFLWIPTDSYKPVAIVHGILDTADSMDILSGYIEKAHPGTEVQVLSILHGYESLQPLWRQVAKFGLLLSGLMNHSKNGIHLIGYSQGGLISRGLVESLQGHNVDTLISLSSPQMGQYGDTNYLRLLFPNYVKSNLYKFFYSHLGQKVSVGNYWKDPHHQDLYSNYSVYLAVLNNETNNVYSTDFKQNFLRLNKFVCIGGPDDGVITPWQSSHFGYYNGAEEIVDITEQEVYIKDSFGLRTMHKNGGLVVHEVPEVKHLEWHKNFTVFNDYILPYLT